jgi:hypothetical protein
VPLSLDTSFAFRPDSVAREPQPIGPSAEDAREFATALARVQTAAPEPGQGPVGATPTGATTLVRTARTRLSGDEAANALRAAWTEVRGQAPTPEALSILVGQWAHETGRGASMLNYNFGGLKGTGPSGLSASYVTHEGWGENAVRVVDRFRAYDSAEDGARDYVSLLARRYPDAVHAAERGDAPGFVHALKARGYFTDNEAAYSRSVQSLASLVLRSGFDALSAGDAEAGAGLELLPAQALGRASDPAPAIGQVRGGGALLGRSEGLLDAPLAGLAVAPAAFADEVHRAALLMSALRIGEPRSRET